MSKKRICLTKLASEHGLPDAALVDARSYSRFKHGDAAVARRFAVALAALAARRLDERPVLVTTSAFAQVPPAAYSLLIPFVQHLRLLRPDLQVGTFRITRRGVSNGDYSRMTREDRRASIGAGDLTPGRDVTGAVVLALDDIRVTGNHERAMDRCLTKAGVAEVRHLYVVDAAAFAECPQIESVLNEAAMGGAAELLDIAAGRRFVPNARLCRRVLALPVDELRDFVERAEPTLLGWLSAAVEHDGLARVPAYEDRVRVWEAVRAELDEEADTGTA
ncbi:MAG TPA: phosphoribosyltransferase family protein [Flexivirga sp.]|uniref:phosphoribosyltransferase family protein n=1 Tax=Flexivirga sp. TaxID=1962927 RepID=UPI002D0B6500|nr:phosphoribosyltransferase family protein [Flexivirga sp.]HWC24715.1 phosphoribosyltransferase family protein [Flexivirga sp.]